MAQLAFSCAASSPPVEGDGYTAGALTVTLASIEQPGVNAAPSPVWFEVASVTGCAATGPTNVRDPKFHDIVYIWDFGDSANATPSNAASLRMPSQWENINRGKGRRVCHVYSDPSPPGGYTVTVTAYERSTMRKGTASTTVTIGDPKTVFPTTRTIIYNPNSDNLTPYGYTGANVQTTWAGVLSARNTLGATTAQILFAPTATLVATQMCDSPSWGNIRIGSIDPTVKPVISGFVNEATNLIRDNNTTSVVERVVFGLRFEGDWDSTTETGRIVRPFNTFNPGNGGAWTYLAMQHRCEFDGWEAVTGHTGVATAYTFYLVHSECNVTNWQNYGFHGCNSGNAHTAAIACQSAQDEDALSGGMKDTGFYNNHGPFRDFGSLTGYLAVCDLFSRNGWSTGGTDGSGASVSGDQACIRVNTNGRDGASWNVERVALEGMIWIEEQDSNNTDRPGNYVFDQILQVMGPRTLIEGNEIRYGGVTYRNVYGVQLGVGSAHTNLLSSWIRTSNKGGATTPFNNDDPLEFYSNTLVDLRNNTQANSVTLQFRSLYTESGAVDFTTINVLNNVMHQPNRSPTVVPDAPIDTTTALGYTPRHRGPRFNFQRLQFSLISAVAPGGDLLIPYSQLRQGKYDLRSDAGTASNSKRVAVTNGSATVTGTSTGFNSDGSDWTGGTFIGPDGLHYPIASMDSATQLTLATNYRGATLSGQFYSLAAYNPGAVTTQSYWTTNRGTRSKIEVAGVTYHEVESDFTVTPEASNMKITNNTGVTWAADALVYIMLDRRGALPAWDSNFDVRSMTVPLPRPQAGSAAINSGDTGAKAVDDFLGTLRPATGDERGALLTA